MATKLSKKEKGFAKDYIDTGNGVQSAMNNYDVSSYSSAGAIASQNLKKLRIQSYIQDHAENAEAMIYTLSQTSEQDGVRLNASKDIMDRAGFKPVEKSQSISVNIEVESTEEIKKLADELNAIHARTDIASDGIVSSPLGQEVQD